MKCPKCLFQSPDNTRFCSNCGTQLIPSAEIPLSKTKTIQTPVRELTRGSTISQRYEVIEELGRGGMGRVYKVLDRQIDEEVALKLLNPDIVSDEKTKQRFRNELKTARRISHKNVCNMYHFSEEEGTLYITMEYVPGEDLKSFVRRIGQFTVGKTVAVAKQVCEGLAEAHRLGVVHRDLKPQNIMIDREGNVRILDFGIARSLQQKKITEAGIIMGTADYMSPEQLEGKEADHRSDIYAMGVILYEMLTGKLPFEGDSPLSIALKHKTELPPDPRRLNPQIPEDLSRLILRCLEKEKERRYKTAEEILSDLDKIEKGIPTTDKLVPLKKPKLSIARKVKRKNLVIFSGAALLVALLVFGGVSLFTSKKTTIHSIAVLPLKNLSGIQEQEYFADGMTEALISSLTQLGALDRVISSTSVMQYKGVHKPLPEIAHELKVDAVVEGSVMQSSGRVRITVQLIEARTDRNLWSKSYERDLSDVLALQSELAREIAREVKIAVSPAEKAILASAQTVNPEAYELYLKGRHFWSKRTEEDLNKALESFMGAVAKDPKYALAYVGIADAYNVLGGYGILPANEAYLKAKNAALKALEINENLAEAYTSLALAKFSLELDWFSAESDFNWAIGLNPSYATAYHWYGNLLRDMGRFDEALAVLNRAQELDPLSLPISLAIAAVFYFNRNYDRAIEQCNKVLELDKSFIPAHSFIGTVYLQKSASKEAIEALQKAVSLSGRSSEYLATLGYAYAVTGKKDEALKILVDLNERSKKRYGPQYEVALIYTALGQKEKAFETLERAYEERSGWITSIKVDPRLDSLRPDPRFSALLEKMGLD